MRLRLEKFLFGSVFPVSVDGGLIVEVLFWLPCVCLRRIVLPAHPVVHDVRLLAVIQDLLDLERLLCKRGIGRQRDDSRRWEVALKQLTVMILEDVASTPGLGDDLVRAL